MLRTSNGHNSLSFGPFASIFELCPLIYPPDTVRPWCCATGLDPPDVGPTDRGLPANWHQPQMPGWLLQAGVDPPMARDSDC